MANELQTVRERLKYATQGKWEWEGQEHGPYGPDPDYTVSIIPAEFEALNELNADNDAEAICLAMNIVGPLLDVLEAAQNDTGAEPSVSLVGRTVDAALAAIQEAVKE